MSKIEIAPEPRFAAIDRHTKETQISIFLGLDLSPADTPKADIHTGVGFLDHMLEAFSKHGHLNLKLHCKGDLHIDQHHTVEDCGIALGQAFSQALGDMAGIERFGLMECPLDEALLKCVLDLSGRPFLHYGVTFYRPFIGQLDSSLLREFFGGFALHAKWTIHLDQIRGENDHHVAEAMFKAFARATKSAIRRTGSQAIPSTKGILV